MWRVHPLLRWSVAIAIGCLITVGCASDSEPATLPAGGTSEGVATPTEAAASQTPATVEEEETSVIPDQPMALADLAAGLLYDRTDTLEFETIDVLGPPCIWHFVRDTGVLDDPGVSIFELSDGSLVVRDPARVITACFFEGGESMSAEAMARVLTSGGSEVGGFTVLVDGGERWARRAGLDFAAPGLAEDGDESVLTFQALSSTDFSVIDVTARRSADGTFSIDFTRHEG